jgi:hypothetical protein
VQDEGSGSARRGVRGVDVGSRLGGQRHVMQPGA